MKKKAAAAAVIRTHRREIKKKIGNHFIFRVLSALSRPVPSLALSLPALCFYLLWLSLPCLGLVRAHWICFIFFSLRERMEFMESIAFFLLLLFIYICFAAVIWSTVSFFFSSDRSQSETNLFLSHPIRSVPCLTIHNV